MSGCGNDKKKAFLTKPTARVRNRIAEIERAQRESAGTLTGKTIFRARVIALPAQEAANVKMADGSPLDGFSDAAFQLKEGSFTMVNYVRVFGLDGSLPDPGEPGITTDSAVIAMAMHGPAYAPEYMNLKCGDVIAVQFEEAPATQLSSQIPKVISKFESDEGYADSIRANLGKSTNMFLGLDSSSFLGNQFSVNKNRAAKLKKLVSVNGNKVRMIGPLRTLRPIFNKLMNDMQASVNATYPAIGLRTQDLGANRDLAESAFTTNPDRAKGSKHGGGFAQDIYMHTEGTEGIGKYTSYKTQNPVLARNGKLVKAMRKFRDEWNNAEKAKGEKGQQLLWGGDFGLSPDTPATSTDMASRGITEFHHWEIPSKDIPTYLKKFKTEMKLVGYDEAAIDKITSYGKLAEFYAAVLKYLGGG